MIKTIDLLAHERHFFDHLMPMFLALPKANRGQVITRDALVPHVRSLLNDDDVEVRSYTQRGHVRGMLRGRPGLVLCGASGDLAAAFKVGRRAVFTQHGAGQSFTKKAHHMPAGHITKMWRCFCIQAHTQLGGMLPFMVRIM